MFITFSKTTKFIKSFLNYVDIMPADYLLEE